MERGGRWTVSDLIREDFRDDVEVILTKRSRVISPICNRAGMVYI